MKRNQGNHKETHKIVLKRRKISKKAISHWKPLTKEKRSFLMSLLKDSMATFIGSDDEEINAVLKKILHNFRDLLHVMKVPEDKWLDPKASYLHQEKLLEQQLEVKAEEKELLSILDGKKRDLMKLQSEVNKVGDYCSENLEVSSICGMPSTSTS